MYDPTVPCKKCSNKVPASQLKLDYDLGLMVCPECVKSKQVRKQIEKEVYHKDRPAPKSMIEERRVKAEQSARVDHTCASCSFKFKINPETKSPKTCPYCNSRILSFS